MRFRNLKKQSKNQNKQKFKQRYVYAPFADRIKALITDMFMIYAPILYFIAYVVMNGKDDFQSSQIAPFMGVLMYGVVYALLLSRFAQTPGKKAYDIKVVDAKSGKSISFLRAFCRFVAFLVSATVVLGVFVPFYRQKFYKDNKALHDLMTNTIVTKV